jgi:TfoX/Sxy family transcriptional regulator of competence genes
MKMPRPSEDAKAAFARAVPDEPAVTIKPMFGQMSAFVNGNMFCGIFGEDFFVRLPEDEIAKVKKQGGRDFEPMAGHKMSGYVMVPGDWRKKPPTALIKRALEETRKMPAKNNKPKKK